MEVWSSGLGSASEAPSSNKFLCIKMHIQTFSHKLSFFTFGSGDLSLQYYSSLCQLLGSPCFHQQPPHTNLHIGSQTVPSGIKTCCGSLSNRASERSGCLFIWQRTRWAKTYCLISSFLCCYNIIILILNLNWIKEKQNFEGNIQRVYS